MKRFFSIIVLIGFLSSTTELHELFKLPHVVYHFFEHRSEHPDVSLAQFLQIHFSQEHSNHKGDNHNKGCLPFQGEHNHPIQLLQFYANNYSDFRLIPQSSSVKNQYFSQSFSPSAYLANIWQPPKV
ncbi:MAG: hypothetical protein A3F72_19875 [Bacteroidetes bacterium RIFCSPLOWO2_12_FULL_35_15]|nr:MAG: hypothetical protein A3F72_19875 [Bacteroidetes bacterium RIFCSPLOWO2_12_FULL_35_15]